MELSYPIYNTSKYIFLQFVIFKILFPMFIYPETISVPVLYSDILNDADIDSICKLLLLKLERASFKTD